MKYFKSFEKVNGNYATCSSHPESQSKQVCQNLTEILASENQLLVPNTLHSQLPRRLCVSRICEGYTETYRPEGLIFETSIEPVFCSPIDVMSLTDGKTFSSGDYHAKLESYASAFMCSSFKEMLEMYPNHGVSLKILNQFREKHNLDPIAKGRIKEYNECCFIDEEIPVKPIGLIGTSKEIQVLADKYKLDLFASSKEYLDNSIR